MGQIQLLLDTATWLARSQQNMFEGRASELNLTYINKDTTNDWFVIL